MVARFKEYLFNYCGNPDYVITGTDMNFSELEIHFSGIDKTLVVTINNHLERFMFYFAGDKLETALAITGLEDALVLFEEILESLYKHDANPEGFRKEVVTVDYDNCFDNSKDVKSYVKFKMLCGFDCFILTYRFDELNKYRYKRSPTNDDLWENVKDYFPDRKVLFMNTELKGKYLAYAQNVVEHIDDSMDEINSIRRYAPHVKRTWFDDGQLKDMMSLYKAGVEEPVSVNISGV